MNRRKFLKSSVVGLSALTTAGGIYSFFIEPFWLEFSRIKMPIKNLPVSLVGKSIMQISDIHVGKRVDHTFLINSFLKAKAFFEPDFVVYTAHDLNFRFREFKS